MCVCGCECFNLNELLRYVTFYCCHSAVLELFHLFLDSHGSLQIYFREIFCPCLGFSEITLLFMLNQNKTIKTKSFIESKIIRPQ